MDPKVPKAPGKSAKSRNLRATAAVVPPARHPVAHAPSPVVAAPLPPLVAAAPAAVVAAPAAVAATTSTPAPVRAPAPRPAPIAPSKPTGSKPAPAAASAPVVTACAPAPQAAPAVPPHAVPRADAAAPTNPPAAKEVIMETIENVTAKAQTAFNDATAQAKGAVEKSQKMFEDANEFGKGNIEALVEASKVAVRGMEALGQDAAAFAKKSFEDATAVAKTLSTVKSPTELMKLQSDYVRSAFDAMVQQTSRNTEAMLKLAGEVAQPLSNRVALAAEKLKVAA